jgi:uncharacterized membrane protein YeaQ/YmgE (transglycosylase-associated protein family)
MGIIAWIVVGAIAGFITNLIMGGREGVIATIILGIVGAVVGGFLAGTVLKVADVTGINVESIVVAVIGAIIVVLVYRAMMGRRAVVCRGPAAIHSVCRHPGQMRRGTRLAVRRRPHPAADGRRRMPSGVGG